MNCQFFIHLYVEKKFKLKQVKTRLEKIKIVSLRLILILVCDFHFLSQIRSGNTPHQTQTTISIWGWSNHYLLCTRYKMEYMKALAQKCLTYLGQDLGLKAIKYGKRMELKVIQLTSGRKETDELVIDPIKVGIVIGIFFVSAVMSFFVAMGGILLDICGTILIVYAPLAVYQTVLLKRYKSVRDYLNLLRRKVNRFHELNKDLEIKEKKLRVKVDALRKINDRFSELTIAEKGDVEELTSVIAELKEINRKMKVSRYDLFVYFIGS